MFDVWRNILEDLKESVPSEAMAAWFDGTKIISNKDGEVVIGASNVFKVGQIEKKYDTQVRKALKKNGVDFKTVRYEVVSGAEIKRRPREVVAQEVLHAEKPKVATSQSSFNFAPKRFNSGLNPEYTLDNFVIGTNNNVAVSVAQSIIDEPGGRFNPFFLYGGPGLGKTHLVQAIGNELLRKNPNLKIKYTSTSDFVSEFIQSIHQKGSNGMNQADIFAQRYRSLDVLIVDDFQMIIKKDASQNAFFDVFNDLYNNHKQVIVTSDRLPGQIKTLDPRLSSRLAMTGPIDLQMPSFEDRCAILRLKAEFMGREVEEEVIEFVASNIQSNIRELSGEFNKVLLLADVKGIRPIEVLHEGYISTPTAARKNSVSPQTIISKTAEEFGITVEQLCGKSRVMLIKNARHVAMYLLQEELGLSTTKTALEIGVKDHTTVMSGVKRIRKELETNFDLREKVEAIKRNLYD